MAWGLSLDARRRAGLSATDDPSLAGGGVEKLARPRDPRLMAPGPPVSSTEPDATPAQPAMPVPVPASPVGGGGLPPIESRPPSLAGLDSGGGGGMAEGAAAHLLSGPVQGRTNIGQRMPPSLAAMLKYRVY